MTKGLSERAWSQISCVYTSGVPRMTPAPTPRMRSGRFVPCPSSRVPIAPPRRLCPGMLRPGIAVERGERRGLRLHLGHGRRRQRLEGADLHRPARSWRRVPATAPSTRNTGRKCGVFVSKTEGRWRSGRIWVRRQWTRRPASQVGTKRTGAGVPGPTPPRRPCRRRQPPARSVPTTGGGRSLPRRRTGRSHGRLRRGWSSASSSPGPGGAPPAPR